jgi:hypothetical protein
MSNNFWNSFSNALDFIFDDCEYYQQRFITACRHNDYELVHIALLLDCIDPTFNNNEAIRVASDKGHITVVNRLFQEDRSKKRVDPSANNNYAIMMASENGHVAVVDRLLQEDRSKNRVAAILSAEILSSAILSATLHNQFDVVDRLLQDPRVEPPGFMDYQFSWATRNGYHNVVNRIFHESNLRSELKENV